MLTQGQIAHFEAFGFLVLPQLFSMEETDALREASLSTFQDMRGGGPYTGEAEWGLPFFERDPLLATLVDDDRVYQIPESLLGSDFFLGGTQGNLRVGDTPWHGATEFTEDIGQIKVAMYFDSATKDTGALRVIPGTHKYGSPDYFELLRPRTDELDFRPFGLAPTEVPCWTLETEPGDVLVFTENLLHGSFGGRPGRHQLSVSFVAHPETDYQEKQIMAFYAKTKYSYRPSKSYVNSDRPRIRRMVSKLVEWGFEQTEL